MQEPPLPILTLGGHGVSAFAHTQIKQIQPELFCNAVLEQAPSWHSASDRAMMTKLVKAGHERVSGTSSQTSHTIITFMMWRIDCQDETPAA